MSTNYIEDDFDGEGDPQETGGGDIKDLRRAANSKKKIEQELAEARRELAFAKAGINPDDPKMKYFVKGYDGELNAEAVREAAIEAGFLSMPQQQQQQQAQQLQAQQMSAAQQNVMAASVGAMPEDMGEQAALSRLEAAMNEGGIEAMLDVARQFGIPTSTEM